MSWGNGKLEINKLGVKRKKMKSISYGQRAGFYDDLPLELVVLFKPLAVDEGRQFEYTEELLNAYQAGSVQGGDFYLPWYEFGLKRKKKRGSGSKKKRETSLQLPILNSCTLMQDKASYKHTQYTEDDYECVNVKYDYSWALETINKYNRLAYGVVGKTLKQVIAGVKCGNKSYNDDLYTLCKLWGDVEEALEIVSAHELYMKKEG